MSNYGLKVMYVDDLQLTIVHSSVLTVLRCHGEILCEVNHRKILRDFNHDLMMGAFYATCKMIYTWGDLTQEP